MDRNVASERVGRMKAELEQAKRPSIPRRLWEGWKRFGRKVGDVQARGLLILFYFVFLAPFALVVRWGSDPLAIKAGTRKGWRPRIDETGSPTERATKQF